MNSRVVRDVVPPVTPEVRQEIREAFERVGRALQQNGYDFVAALIGEIEAGNLDGGNYGNTYGEKGVFDSSKVVTSNCGCFYALLSKVTGLRVDQVMLVKEKPGVTPVESFLLNNDSASTSKEIALCLYLQEIKLM